MKLLSVVAMLSASLCGCLWDVGKDPEGKRLEVQAERVITSVNAYRAKYGALPDRLELLVPEFISEPPEHITFNPFSGLVSFHYQPSWPMPAMSASCSTHVEHVQWHCSGAM